MEEQLFSRTKIAWEKV